ncbi:MAG TPA: lipid IV(A) 3-deoxy-D-manno-octulosonic acid transferase [Accumulibacter sp.]|uniref:lipid IV(A) 3-deoxy-D-manno-octulosonic acid transferase n=1 Tax=Accumulibacter sp. TaxID=2053492 RepID=UPI002BE24325|nr:lipid IV(A) 3-deoxy-D-manno-octulosonic acid transferase [Accumulibacter sp.]HMV06256.1 lipid IV(A) 3-deoxy-D-manno-octulosonic acid transferase [Accumulibacter sp.]HNE41024.1 lipid IV(A) 3-deoxy-D-manno-octulosonic acid transferase [Accumulibacter sp.]
MSRLLYALLFYLAMPLVWLRLLWRAIRQAEYLQHLGERHGHYRQPSGRPLIWLHAVSVGETRAAEPLIEALLGDYAQHDLLLTHMTPTGRAAGLDLLKKHPGRIIQAYLPYDLPHACRRFLDVFQPRVGLLMETEIWPNLMAAARQRGVPIALVNARLSLRSQRAYARARWLIEPAIASFAVVAAQTEADGERLRELAAREVAVCGNLKFDVTPAAERLELGARWRHAIGPRRIWLVASTREGEEALILDALGAIALADLLVVVVPRHPQRFDEVARLLEQRRLSYRRRSSGVLPDPATRVWLGDSMGEMAAYYALADIALIGGSLLPFGGQNLIEAAACGCPVLVGEHTFNFAQASQDAVASGAARRVADARQAALVVAQLFGEPGDARQSLDAMRAAAMRFSAAHRGATARTLALIRPLIEPRAVR